ncbi:hypothetical protein HGRIS_005589 [Hohenbuehelia grisea]|uniref:Glutathione synthetase n=1 Tax=Hohenbuehelia grisea TaxID=104357 RepID=A0ABR3JZL4_9AGAR
MTTSFSFADWPPALDDVQLDELILRATTYALSHGLTYLPVRDQQPRFPLDAIHAPLSIFPAPIPRTLFEQAQKLQRIYNVLYARIAMDDEFLDEVMGAEKGVGQVDDFVGQLWAGWKQLRDDGVKQTLQLGLFRSDYLLHQPAGADALSLKQVEFNTISSSFGTLSERVAALHRHLYAATGYFNVSSYFSPQNFPPNETTAGLVSGLVAAHKAYGVDDARILFVVQAGERNVFDQRWLEYELLEKHSIHVIRQTFSDLSSSASVDSDSTLWITRPTSSPTRISTIYFRAGYTPTDYPTRAEYTTRFLLERSSAISCPSVALQLAGGKKVQQVLTRPGVLERFLDPREGDGTWGEKENAFGKEELDALRESWVGMWGLDEDGNADPSIRGSSSAPLASGSSVVATEPRGTASARTHAARLVLKPQREGGGNNVYKAAIPAFLDTLPPRERAAWIAMELIEPPEGVRSFLVRAGGGGEGGGRAVRTEVVSELGIFGWALFGEQGEEKAKERKVLEEREVGWLVRTKGKESDEGGVATGFSVLDSIVLV